MKERVAAPPPQLPPARPRQKPFVHRALVRENKDKDGLIIRKMGTLDGDGVGLVLKYVDECLKGLAIEMGKVRDKDLTDIESALNERMKPFRYVGQWSCGMESERGNSVSYGGSLWHCNEGTKEKPGTSDKFTLAVKRGRDGRDTVKLY